MLLKCPLLKNAWHCVLVLNGSGTPLPPSPSPPVLCLKTHHCGTPSWEEPVMRVGDRGQEQTVTMRAGRGLGPCVWVAWGLRLRGRCRHVHIDFTSMAQRGWVLWMVGGLKVQSWHYRAMLRWDIGLFWASDTQECDWATQSPDWLTTGTKAPPPLGALLVHLCVVSS